MRLLWYIVLAVIVVILTIGWGQATSAQAGCDPSYPDFCIPSPPPDLDCQDKAVNRQNFRVLPPDPHHFDGDGDGIGCEPPP